MKETRDSGPAAKRAIGVGPALMKVGTHLLTVGALAVMPLSAHAALLGPTPYSSLADSPFFPVVGFTYFHLENFDDHALNTPGVTASDGQPTTTARFSGSIIDQVGLPGGCPPGGAAVPCDTWGSFSGPGGVGFLFNAAVLGALPTAVGVVWTEGLGTTTFEAFDQDGIPLGTVAGDHADASFFGTTGEDRFYGVAHSGGISQIHIRNTADGIEIDHLQYGLRADAPPPRVPVPSSLMLVGLGLAVVTAFGRRHGRSAAPPRQEGGTP